MTVRPARPEIFARFDAPKCEILEKTHAPAQPQARRHRPENERVASPKGAKEEVVDGQTQRTPRGLQWCAAHWPLQPARRRESRRWLTGCPSFVHAQTVGLSMPHLSYTTPKIAMLLEQMLCVPAKAQPHHAVSGRQAAAWHSPLCYNLVCIQYNVQGFLYGSRSPQYIICSYQYL